MKCIVCGRDIIPGNKFCIYCGVPVTPSEEVSMPIEDEESNLIKLSDENGNDISFEFLDFINYLGNDYVVLLPIDDDADEVVILQVEQTGDEESYTSVDDESTVNVIFSMFKERNKDFFEFER